MRFTEVGVERCQCRRVDFSVGGFVQEERQRAVLQQLYEDLDVVRLLLAKICENVENFHHVMQILEDLQGDSLERCARTRRYCSRSRSCDAAGVFDIAVCVDRPDVTEARRSCIVLHLRTTHRMRIGQEADCLLEIERFFFLGRGDGW